MLIVHSCENLKKVDKISKMCEYSFTVERIEVDDCHFLGDDQITNCHL